MNYPREIENITPYPTQDDYDKLHVCAECEEEYGATHAGDDVLGYCHYCQIVEGDTKYIFENQHTGEKISEEDYDVLPEAIKPN